MVIDGGRTGRLPDASSAIETTGLVDYLRDDPRPTLAIELTSDLQADLGINFANRAFKEASTLVDIVVTAASSRRSCFRKADPEVASFAIWARCGTRLERFRFRNFLFTATTVNKRWRVLSGVSLDGLGQRSNAFDSEGRDGIVVSASQTSQRPDEESEVGSESSSHGAVPRFVLVANPPSPHNQLIVNFDWSSTPLGPISEWPAVLCQFVTFLMSNSEPTVSESSLPDIRTYGMIGISQAKCTARSDYLSSMRYPLVSPICPTVPRLAFL